jgi:thiol-disulfide isomerase/thioredoxin
MRGRILREVNIMALTASVMRELGSTLPPFRLPDPDGKLISSQDFDTASALLVAFWCNHCPFVKHIKAAFSQFATEYQAKGLAVVAINANDASTHPADAPERMREDSLEFAYTFPYLYDADQSVARAFQASCTPDFFLYDRSRRLVYRGQFDASRPGNDQPVTGADLSAAVDAAIAGRPVARDQHPSIGCNIKWRPGQAPDYARS